MARTTVDLLCWWNIERVQFLVLSRSDDSDQLNLGKLSVHTILAEHWSWEKHVQKLSQSSWHLTNIWQGLDAPPTGEASLKIPVSLKDCHQIVSDGDESWFYEYDIELNSQSKECEAYESRSKICQKSWSKIQSCWFLFDTQRVVHQLSDTVT